MKTLVIEWKHLEVDGNTCVRCSDTGEALREAIEQLAEECRSLGWEIKFKETRLAAEDVAESNAILFNGKPLEALLPEARASATHCESCSRITGKSTACRTIEFAGDTYGSIPASLIRQAAGRIIHCC